MTIDDARRQLTQVSTAAFESDDPDLARGVLRLVKIAEAALDHYQLCCGCCHGVGAIGDAFGIE